MTNGELCCLPYTTRCLNLKAAVVLDVNSIALGWWFLA